MQLEGLLLPTHLATEKFRHFLFLAATVVDATFGGSGAQVGFLVESGFPKFLDVAHCQR